MTLTPDDFRLSLVEEAYRLRRGALAQSGGYQLDPKTAMWVIRLDAWRESQASADFLKVVQYGPTVRNELLGLPVRLTIDDSPDAPMIQLVMEPHVGPRRTRPGL